MLSSSGPPPVVRRASGSDLDVVVGVLVESHVEYVWERWALPVDDRRKRLEELYRSDVSNVALRVGEVWMTDCGESVAVWLPAGAVAGLDVAEVGAVETAAAAAFGSRRLQLLDEVEAAVARTRPTHDWFLATMGTRPGAQRRGLGSAVLQPRLTALDGANARAVLDTSDLDNVGFYRRFGFEIVAELDRLPHGAPTTWVMSRDPREPGAA
jgi:ribosomal protein S18 acetylase RimI-like enzyme